VDTATLTPTQELCLEVLAGRYRLGEQIWTFRSRTAPALAQLEELGLVYLMHGVVDGTVRAGLTEAGRDAILSSTYTPPLAAAPSLVAPYDGSCNPADIRSFYTCELDYLRAIDRRYACANCGTATSECASCTKLHERIAELAAENR
jgi:hypothetical protein